MLLGWQKLRLVGHLCLRLFMYMLILHFVFRLKTGTTNDLEAVVKLRCFVVHHFYSQEGNQDKLKWF